MLITTTSTSESVIGNLCKEVYLIRHRSKNLIQSIEIAKDTKLKKRLRKELLILKERKKEILQLAVSMKTTFKQNIQEMSLLFLIEISHRD